MTVYFHLWKRYVVNITSIDFHIFPQHKLHTNVNAKASRTTTTGESVNHCSFNKLIIIMNVNIFIIIIIIILISKNWTRKCESELGFTTEPHGGGIWQPCTFLLQESALATADRRYGNHYRENTFLTTSWARLRLFHYMYYDYENNSA